MPEDFRNGTQSCQRFENLTPPRGELQLEEYERFRNEDLLHLAGIGIPPLRFARLPECRSKNSQLICGQAAARVE